MFEGAKFWPKGHIRLYLNNKPANVYISHESVKSSFNFIQSFIKENGALPIGVDHFPEQLLSEYPILKKMNILHVGDIHEIELKDDELYIKKAEIYNPTIQELYKNGEIDSLSIVGAVKTVPCKDNSDINVITENNIYRVDIVGKGACDSCKIPAPNAKANSIAGINSMVSAKIPIKYLEEKNNMSNKEELDLAQGEFGETAPMPTKQKEEEPEKPEKGGSLDKIVKQLTMLVNKLNKIINKEEEPEKPEKEEAEFPEYGAMAKQVEDLQEQIKSYENAQASAVVEQMIAAGKVAPANKEAFVKFAVADLESATKVMASLPEQFDTTGEPASLNVEASNPTLKGEPTPEEQNLSDVLDAFNIKEE